ncbi:hypothetical protein K435DRAFT_777562 [Dendrothele bispora CBS 962.96]|uniref:Uncharacterized protein n=1 Tax=Dendrothele bispora (strain CBS 962.96) TaxID=1314807 RepID=A0A4S8M7Z7_DENBC|nr:hypothetical protein K435DRAFT_777562 [Dendrothele bispora CBS 962.96]
MSDIALAAPTSSGLGNGPGSLHKKRNPSNSLPRRLLFHLSRPFPVGLPSNILLLTSVSIKLCASGVSASL